MRVVLVSIFVFLAVIILGIFIFSVVRNGGVGGDDENKKATTGNILVIKTIDGGNTWNAASNVFVPPQTDAPDDTTIDAKIPRSTPFDLALLTSKPQQDDTLLLSTNDGGLFTTTNGSALWHRVAPENELLANRGNLTRITAQTNGDGIVYVSYAREGGSGVLRIDTHADPEAVERVYVGSNAQDTVTAVAIDQNDSNTVTIGTSKGAIIQTTNRGQTWRTLQFFEKPIFNLATSNRDSRALYMHTQDQLYKSFDRGTTWDHITPIFRSALPRNAKTEIRGLITDPSDSLTVYVATPPSLVRKKNGGNSWEFLPLPSSRSDISITSLAIQPTDPRVIYVSSGSTMYKSVDSAATWHIFPIETSSIIGNLTVSASNPAVLYATIKQPEKKSTFSIGR